MTLPETRNSLDRNRDKAEHIIIINRLQGAGWKGAVSAEHAVYA